MRGQPFPPGRSGNPSGRPKSDRRIEALARKHTAEAIAALVLALQDRGTRVAAACALLDRGWGKPRNPAGDGDRAEKQPIYFLASDEKL